MINNEDDTKRKTAKFKHQTTSVSPTRKMKRKTTKHDSTQGMNKKSDKYLKMKSTLVEDVMFKNLELTNDIKIILIKEAFRMFDADESGYIDKKEFRKLIQSLGIEMNVKKIDELMRNVDKDGSGSIDIEEFTVMMLKYQFNQEIPISTHLDSAFNLYDKDGDGIISEEDLLKVALELDEDIKQDEALIIINLAKTLMTEIENNIVSDEDTFGINKKEFVNLLLKTKFLTDQGGDVYDKTFNTDMISEKGDKNRSLTSNIRLRKMNSNASKISKKNSIMNRSLGGKSERSERSESRSL